MKKIKSFNLFEGGGISDIIKEYADVISDDLDINTKLKYQYDLDYEPFPLLDLRVEYELSDKYHAIYDPTKSTIVDNKLNNITIKIKLDKSNINKIKINGVIAHELTHVKEYFDIQKKMLKLNIKIRPSYLDIRQSYQELKIDESNIYYEFIYLLYLSLDTEMNARISQVYSYLYNFKNKDENFLIQKLKEHENWKYLEMLQNFNYKTFVDNCITKLEYGFITITNDLIEKFKGRELNKSVKLLNFLDNYVGDTKDLYSFYKECAEYFKKKSNTHYEKFMYLIKEVIEDLNGNRPYNEDYRNKQNDPF